MFHLISVNDFFKEVFGELIAKMIGSNYDDEFKNGLTLLVTIIQLIPLFLGTILKKAGTIRYFGLSVVFMVVYLACISVYQAPAYVREIKPTYQAFGTKKFFHIIHYFGVFLFAYDSAQSYHQVYSSMKLPTVRRIRKIGVRISAVLFILYFIYTLAAYVSLGTTMQKNFDIFPSRKPVSSDPYDILMKFLKLVMLVSLIPSSIVNSIPLRRQLVNEIGLPKTPFSDLLASIMIITAIGLLSYFYRQITNWMSLLGAIGSNSLAVLLPTLCYFQAYRDKEDYRTSLVLVITWCVFTTTMSVLCIMATFLDMQGYRFDW